MKFYLFLLTFVFASCARVQTLNLKPHPYSERPSHILWLQIAGLSEEHLPLLRFNAQDSSYVTEFEKMSCHGKIWNFNLYEMRPSANKSFISQINGTKNVTGTCSDYEKEAGWSYLQELSHHVAIMENGVSKNDTMLNAIKCNGQKFIRPEEIRFYSMTENNNSIPDAKAFHYQDSGDVAKERTSPGIYFDKSCHKGICYSSLSSNVNVIWGQFFRERNKSLMIVRDFSLKAAIDKKDIAQVRDSLSEINKVIAQANELNNQNILVIVTAGESIPLEFPNQGKEWMEYLKSGKNVIYKKPALMSPVFAKGPMAENFCGIFDESDFLKRLLHKPEEKVFSIDNVLPF